MPLTVLSFEDQNEYNKLHAAFVNEYTPTSPTEEALVQQIADAQWKLRRLDKIEQRVFSKLMAETTDQTQDPIEAIAATLLAPGKGNTVLAQLARYESTLNRQFNQAVNLLRKLQKDRADEYRHNLKIEALHHITGRADRSQVEKLAFHLVAQDPDAITRYVDVETQASALELKRERRAA